MSIPESRWIVFTEHPAYSRRRTKTWAVRTRDRAFGSDFADGEWLGDVRWYAPWRKYVFNPAAACVFEGDCLRDIIAFIEKQTRLRREERAREKEAERGEG